jgi:hypothetical protein
MMVDVPDVPIGELVEEYQPDVVVEMLGVNDLLFGGRSPETVANRVAQFVDEARGARADVDFVLAEATQTWWTWVGVADFNGRLQQVAAAKTDDDSAVVVADTDNGYAAAAHTWDDSHPNAAGEVRIAAAVADSLAQIGVGPPATRPLAAVPLGPRTAPRLRAVPGDGVVTLFWNRPPGVTNHLIWLRDVTAKHAWHRLVWPVAETSWQGQFTNGHRYRFKLQPAKGRQVAAGDVRSNIVEVLPQRVPDTVGEPRLEPRRNALRASWRAVRRATSYELSWWRVGRPDTVRTRTVTGTSARIGALRPGKKYAVTVRGVNDTGDGRVSRTAVARTKRP